jgi:antitoxin (DNA-binding transcriptional repressor) of toxin-antitoxin stability system
MLSELRQRSVICRVWTTGIDVFAWRDGAMMEMQTFEAPERLRDALDAVERGETVVITRDGRPIARVIPEQVTSVQDGEKALLALEALRARMPKVTAAEILAWRDEGRKS